MPARRSRLRTARSQQTARAAEPGRASGVRAGRSSGAPDLRTEPSVALEQLRGPASPEGRASAVVALSGVVGNCALTAMLSGTSRSQPAAAVSRLADDVSGAESSATEIYDALDGWNDVPRVMTALRGAHAAWGEVESAFSLEHGSIWEYLKDQLSTEEVIDAYAYLLHGHTNDLQVGLARALIASGTRDAEIHRILGSVKSHERKDQLATDYAADYCDLGAGTLRGDIIADQEDWELHRSLILLDHDITGAEELYLDSVGMVGTETSAVVSRLQKVAGESDPNAFAAFEADWNQYVAGTAGWWEGPPEKFTALSIRDAMAEELSGEEAGLALAAIDNGRLRSGNAAGAVPAGIEGAPEGAEAMAAEQIIEDERIRLQMHEAYVNAAAEGAGTNEQQIFDGVEAIRAIWEQRISRASAAGDDALVAEYRTEWLATQERLRPSVNEEMRESGVENMRVRLLLAGPLKPADELYMARADGDNDAAVATVTGAWAKGEIDALVRDASTDRLDDEGNVVRPAFDPVYAIPVNSGVAFRRISWLLNADLGDIDRGARRLQLEIQDGSADSDCERAVQFLRTEGLTAARRAEVIGAFVALQGIGEREEPTPEQKFTGYVSERFEQSTATWAMRDLIDPTSDPADLLARAQGRHDAAHSGLIDAIVTDFATDWGHMTGEDTVEVEQESLARLEFIANSGTSPAELEALLALTGKASISDLAAFQYEEYQKRLDELRALKSAITEGLAAAVEILAAAALTVATAGAGGGALVSAIGSAVAGMITRKLATGTDYELLSDDNVKALIVTTVTAGVGEFVGPAVKGMESLNRFGSARTFVAGALTDGAKAVTGEAVEAYLSDKMPTTESIATSVLKVLGASASGGLSAHLGEGLDSLPYLDRIVPTVRAQIAGSIVSGTFDVASGFTTGTGELSATDIVQAFALRIAKAFGEGTIGGLAEVAGSAVGDQREAASQGPPADDPAAAGNQPPSPDATDPSAATTESSAPVGGTPVTADGTGGGGGAGNEPPGHPSGGGDGDEPGALFPGLTGEEVGGAVDALTVGPMVEGPGGAETARSLVDMAVVSRLNEEVRELAQGQGVRPPPEAGAEMNLSDAEVAIAARMLENPDASPLAINQALTAIVERAVADFRARWPHARRESRASPGLTADALRGACGVGRDITADSIASLTIDSQVPIVIHRIQARHLGLGAHAFTVVALPDGQRWLVDATVAQFTDQVGGRTFTAGEALADPQAATTIRDLQQNGFIPLTAESATNYALALGAPASDAASLGARLMSGDASVLTEVIANGAVSRESTRAASAYDEVYQPVDPEQERHGSIAELDRFLDRMPPEDPSRPMLLSLRERLIMIQAVQPSLTEEGIGPPPGGQ